MKSAFLSISAAFLLVSCGGNKVEHANYIPANSCFVMSLNTEEIFSDAFFDLIANNDLTNNIAEGPLAGMMQDPGNAGIKRLTKYHFFGTGANFLEGKMGAVLPLNDKEKLAQYIETNWDDVEVVEDSIYLVAEISNEHNIVWNENTAIYFYSPFGGDVIAEAQKLFKQTEEQSLAKQDSTFEYALNNDAHIATWIKNDDFVAFVDEGLKMAANYELFEQLNVNKEDIKGAKSVFLANFNDGNITVEQRQYLNPTQMAIYNSFEKPNNLAGLTKIVNAAEPNVLITASLKSDGLKSLLKEYNMDKMWKDFTKNSLLSSVELSQLSQYFDGDVLLLVNGVEMVEKTIVEGDLDDEGNDIEVERTVSNPVPNMVLGLTMKDASKFNLSLGMVAALLPKYEGFSNYNDEVYFKVSEEMMLITGSKQGVNTINSSKGGLKPELKELVGKHRTAAYLNFAGILAEIENLSSFKISGAENLKSLTLSEKGVAEEGIVEGRTVIQFVNNENGLISTFKLINGLGSVVRLFSGAFHI